MEEKHLIKLSNLVSPIVLIAGALYTLFTQFSLSLLLTFTGFLIVFVFLTFYNWTSKDKNKEFFKSVSLSIKIFIWISILLTVLLTTLSFLHSKFPRWHSDYTSSHFLKVDEVKELNPHIFKKDSLVTLNAKLDNTTPYLLVKDNIDIFFFENEKITGELIRYGSDEFRKFCNYVLLILFILSIVLIYLDKIPAREA